MNGMSEDKIKLSADCLVEIKYGIQYIVVQKVHCCKRSVEEFLNFGVILHLTNNFTNSQLFLRRYIHKSVCDQ